MKSAAHSTFCRWKPAVLKLNYRPILAFFLGAACYVLAISMFFYFPGVEDWTFAALRPLSLITPVSVYALLVVTVIFPALLGPVFLIGGARHFVRAKLAGGCLTLAFFFLAAAPLSVLLYGRVALIALLTGQLLALGSRARASIMWNWLVYFGFMLANSSFPDGAILSAANYLAGAYLLLAGLMIWKGKWETGDKEKSSFRVMVG